MTLQVLPDLRTVSLDEGFSYGGYQTPAAVVGSIVRIPLAGRVVRGWVLDRDDGPEDGLKSVRAVSGDLPVFDTHTLPTLQWIAQHYVAPLASIIRSASPPNLPRKVAVKWDEPSWLGPRGEARGHVMPADPWPEVLEAVVAEQERGGSSLVIVPTMEEVAQAAERLSGIPNLQVLDADVSDHSATTIWSRTRATGGAVILGTARCALWPIRHLGLTVLIEEGRGSHKARQSPTLHTRTLLEARMEIEGIRLLTTGTVPSTEVVGAGSVLHPSNERPWGMVEIADRSLEPPGRGVLGERMKAGLHWAVREQKSVAVFTHRRGFAPAFRCVACGELRVCAACGSRARTTDECERCTARLTGCTSCGEGRFEPMGLGIGRLVSAMESIWSDNVGVMGQGRLITAVTERDLPGLGSVHLAVIVDADGLLLGTNYRAAEDAVRLMASVAGHATERTLVQTLSPSLLGVQALVQGSPEVFIRSQLVERRKLGFPPCGEIVVLEVRDGPDEAANRIGELARDGVQVFGPHESPAGFRWLIQGASLTSTRVALREIAEWLRRQGASLRIDVDPLDL